MIEEINEFKECAALFPQDWNYIKDSIFHTFKNVILIDKKIDKDEIIAKINGSKIKKIYIIGNDNSYNYILPRIKKEISICWIFNNSFSSLSDYTIRYNLNCIMEYIDRELVDLIGCTNIDTYKVFKNAGYKCEYIEFKFKNKSTKSKYSNTIGVLSNEYDPNNNLYNQLAALTFVDYEFCKINFKTNTTKDFIKKFNIKFKKLSNVDQIIKDNFINLYINFTNTNIELINKSFNFGVPCIIGNINIFDNNEYLKEHLVLKSDDDINEIVEKINYVKNNREKILNEYKNLINNN